MSLFTVFQISSQGMTAQRERLEAASANLANSNTTRTAEGGPYRRRDVVFETQGIEKPSQLFELSSFDSVLEGVQSDKEGVKAEVVLASSTDVIKQFNPNHPDADADGYVTMPNVDTLEETVNMLSAARSFEANATAFNTAKEMMRASLNLGDA
jgi:flagellar basal-body rod protein FlgC